MASKTPQPGKQGASSPDELRLLAAASPAGLGLATDRRFAYPPHLQRIDEEVVEAIARAKGRSPDDPPEILLVAVPPRHGKSTLISRYTPAWFLGLFPHKRVILCSYEADFAATWGRQVREILSEHGPTLYGVSIDDSSRARNRWNTDVGGGMMTAGVGGPVTGKGADLLVIDDPIKDQEQAMSETIRAKQIEWWHSVARTRLEPGATVIVLMTRWHEGDLGGYLLRDSGDPVRHLRLPALALEDDPLGRSPGEALWPERYSRRYLEHTRDGGEEGHGAYWFSAMYQGWPVPDEGGVFQRRDFRYFELKDGGVLLRDTGEFIADPWLTKFQVVDLAASEKETADYTVIAELWVTPKRQLLVRSVHRERLALPDQPAFFEAHHAGGRVFFESIGYQSGIVKTMLRRGFPAEPVYPDKDKVTRAGAAGALYRGGQVYHLAGAEWLADFEHELLAFPAGEHDDQVDTIAYAAKALPNVAVRGSRRRREDPGTVLGSVGAMEF